MTALRIAVAGASGRMGRTLVEAVRRTGYGAELPTAARTAFEEQEAQDRATAEEYHELRRKSVIALTVGLLTMASMPFMHRAHWLPWVQLVATAAIMATAGRHFFVRAWAAFRHHSADMNTLIAVGTGAAFV